MENDLSIMMDISLTKCKEIVEIFEKNNMINNQEFLDWLDELNKISVSY